MIISLWPSFQFVIEDKEIKDYYNKNLHPHGHWIWDEDGMDWGIGAWRCSECKAMSPMWWNTDKTTPYTKSGHRYCPNCGARMDKKGDGE